RIVSASWSLLAPRGARRHGVDARLGEDLGGVLAEAWRAAVDRRGGRGELDRGAGQHDRRVVPRLLDLDQHAARLRVRVLEDVLGGVHRAYGHLPAERRPDLAP